jgi:hypothetical protein
VVVAPERVPAMKQIRPLSAGPDASGPDARAWAKEPLVPK